MNIGNLYDEMTTKFGFSDGEAVPFGIEKVRKEIVGYININLPPDCPVEAYEYDRAGVHNWCLILYRNKETKEDVIKGLPTAEIGDIIWEMSDKFNVVSHVKMYKLVGKKWKLIR